MKATDMGFEHNPYLSPSGGQTGVKRTSILREIWKARKWYLFVAPVCILFAVFLLYPVVQSFRLSFFITDLYYQEFVGLQNYKTILTDRNFWLAIYNTFYLGFFHVLLGIPPALLLANLLNKKIRGRNILRVLYYLPHVTSIVAVSVVWSYLFDVNYGPLNYILKLVGLPTSKWIAHPSTSKLSIVLMTVWHGLGYRMVIVLAGLQSIPRQLYEAAEIDGADGRKQFFHITLPLLQPTIAFLVITATIKALQRFDEVYMFGTELGMPSRSLSTIVLYLYERGFMYNEFGIASAAAYVLFVIILAITIVNLKLNKKTQMT